ncbi:TPA: cupredoxin domain-containing protein [archaeon]|uniref:Cupredoxin domain-containing protein n=1 Tax=Candidatus Naiadarchaeum limnaeum TaxID=2756139 RepID=A0A832UP93_9ARCH|nr:cupredoxin domain-containing protein [Candidatus Naiadarchaeales archaeon SRR2090153.bin1042]HIK00884.1 cupredoxin domain-containing protein [Candidatus Naiadarchaeum limnaeum]
MKITETIIKFALAFLIVGSVAAFAQSPSTIKKPTSTPTEVDKLILVSNNEADLALALSVASDINLAVISTNWGQFQKVVFDRIKALSPTEVIVVGGNSAVPEKYKSDLEAAGLKVTIVGGKTRQQTSIQVYEKFKTQLKKKALVASGKEPITTSDTIPVYAYDDSSEIKKFAQKENADATDQADVKATGVNPKLIVTKEMVAEVKSLIQEYKNVEGTQGYAIGQKVSEIVKTHGDAIKALAASKAIIGKAIEKAEQAVKASVKTIELRNNNFVPSILAVSKGDKIVWANKDNWAHTVTLKSLGIDRRLEAGQTFEWTVTSNPGIIEYECTLHQPSMDGKITVASKEQIEQATKLVKDLLKNTSATAGIVIQTGGEIPY